MWQRHWWNGRWRAGRRDVYIHASPWRVEARAGGVDGNSTVAEVADEAEALEFAQRWMKTDDDWRELTVR